MRHYRCPNCDSIIPPGLPVGSQCTNCNSLAKMPVEEYVGLPEPSPGPIPGPFPWPRPRPPIRPIRPILPLR
jgi:hypothetical protein